MDYKYVITYYLFDAYFNTWFEMFEVVDSCKDLIRYVSAICSDDDMYLVSVEQQE